MTVINIDIGNLVNKNQFGVIYKCLKLKIEIRLCIYFEVNIFIHKLNRLDIIFKHI